MNFGNLLAVFRFSIRVHKIQLSATVVDDDIRCAAVKNENTVIEVVTRDIYRNYTSYKVSKLVGWSLKAAVKIVHKSDVCQSEIGKEVCMVLFVVHDQRSLKNHLYPCYWIMIFWDIY